MDDEKLLTSYERQQAGLWYGGSQELGAAMKKAEILYCRFNVTTPNDAQERQKILRELLPNMGEKVNILTPFYTDYGYNCVIGDSTFVNHGAYFMDCAKISIGRSCFLGPFCGLYTAMHPIVADERDLRIERALPITIEDSVWFGGNVIVMPGVTIGKGSVIGAGSVVTKDIPAGVVAVGNPCRVIRKITDDDRIRTLPPLST